MDNEIPIKPCPFCGGEAETQTGNMYAFIECSKCDCRSVEHEDFIEAIKAWNTRSHDAFTKYLESRKLDVEEIAKIIKKEVWEHHDGCEYKHGEYKECPEDCCYDRTAKIIASRFIAPQIKECQERWVEYSSGYLVEGVKRKPINVVCGHPLPCPKHSKQQPQIDCEKKEVVRIALESGFMISSAYGQKMANLMPTSDVDTLVRFAEALSPQREDTDE